MFTEPEGNSYKIGGVLTDQGDKPAGTRIRSSTEGDEGEVGRLAIGPGADEVELAITHDPSTQSSAISASELKSLDYTKRREVSLAGDPDSGGNYRIRYSLHEPSRSSSQTAVQVSTGDPKLWLTFERELRGSSGG